jgi:hypothetical protein
MRRRIIARVSYGPPFDAEGCHICGGEGCDSVHDSATGKERRVRDSEFPQIEKDLARRRKKQS